MTIADEIQKALTDCVNDIKRRSTQAGQVATGRTLRALEVRVRREGVNVIGEIWGRPFTGVLETGSRPASRASRNPKLTRKVMAVDLAEWMRIRGLTNGLTDEQRKHAAEHLAWYIRKYGSALYRKGGRRDIITPAVEATKNELTERLGAYYEQLLTSDINVKFFG
jgi:hypothetical protein